MSLDRARTIWAELLSTPVNSPRWRRGEAAAVQRVHSAARVVLLENMRFHRRRRRTKRRSPSSWRRLPLATERGLARRTAPR